MADGRRDAHIARHIELVAARVEQDTLALISAMVGRSWPGGAHDRSEPAALAWVRRWGPSRTGVAVPACSCAVGRCGVCN